VAVLAAQAQEALLQAVALQVRIELLLDVVRQWSACFGTHLPKCRIVALHQLIQQRGFRAMAGVACRLEKWRRARSPRSGGDGHGRRPCNGRGRNRLSGDSDALSSRCPSPALRTIPRASHMRSGPASA
jgi:hypothetical protein